MATSAKSRTKTETDGTVTAVSATEEELLTQAPDDWEFETIIEQTPAKLTLEVGDAVILKFKRIDHIINPRKAEDNDEEDFDLLVFESRSGEPYSISPSHRLATEAGKFVEDEFYRITLKGELPSRKGNPMKDYKVERAIRKV